jgi:hypothetical protein
LKPEHRGRQLQNDLAVRPSGFLSPTDPKSGKKKNENHDIIIRDIERQYRFSHDDFLQIRVKIFQKQTYSQRT